MIVLMLLFLLGIIMYVCLSVFGGGGGGDDDALAEDKVRQVFSQPLTSTTANMAFSDLCVLAGFLTCFLVRC